MYLSTPAAIEKADLLFIAGTAAILIKLASAPFHRWFVEIVPKVRIKTRILLITWQKLAPVYILIFMIKPVVLARILIRGFLGRIIQIIKSKLIEIMALSSIFNLSWIILASTLRRKTLFVFIRIY
jgi:NADH-ubiquinone oxidoreductase chain 2